LAIEIVSSVMPAPECPCSCRIPEHEPQPAPKPRPRATPQSTIEALLCGIAARGPAALKEPANRERLSRCDKAAIQEIDRRMAKIGGGK
jgi:hypothetical protein